MIQWRGLNRACLAALVALLGVLSAAAADPMLMGANGGAFFLAEPGPLIINVTKQNIGTPTDLRVVLVGPDRRPITDQRIAAGSAGQKSTIQLTTQVERKGVYVLQVTAANDRYGTSIAWGFTTNCPKYLIESSRGHRDEAHQEPIMLHSPALPGNIAFMPPADAFQINASNLAAGTLVTLYDANGGLIQNLTVTNNQAQAQISAQVARTATPWRLYLSKASGTIEIDGVTRWRTQDIYKDLAVWTPSVSAWFDLLPNRWLVTPYRKLIYGQAGKTGAVKFKVHNNGPATRVFNLALEAGTGSLQAQLSTSQLTLTKGQSAEVTVQYTVPAQGRGSRHLRVTPAGQTAYSTYSTLEVAADPDPARAPLTMPMVIQPFEHEAEKYGYQVDYPTDWEMYHDLDNRPYVVTDKGVMVLRGGVWELSDFSNTVTVASGTFTAASFVPDRRRTKIAFDDRNELYLPVAHGRGALLHSRDGGRTFTAYDLGLSGNFDIEQFSGHNVPTGAPWVLRHRGTNLELIPVTRNANGSLTIGTPIILSTATLGVGAHSGIASAILSRGNRVHVIWGDATTTTVPGVPAYVVSYDRTTRQPLGQPVLLGYGPPANDGHNRHSITIDSQGTLHALIGTHNYTFQYARSLQPNTAHGGWTTAAPVIAGARQRQTYIGLVCDREDTLHLVNRHFIYEELNTSAYRGVLSHQIKRAGQSWEAPRRLWISPLSEYSIFYHRLTIDRLGHLHLSYDYWSTFWFYRNDHLGTRRTSIYSTDRGQQWRLLFSDQLMAGTRTAADRDWLLFE